MKKIFIVFNMLLVSMMVACSAESSKTQTTTTINTTNTNTEVSTLCDHSLISIGAKDATCDEDGLTAGLMCSKCNKVFVERERVPASHNMEFYLFSPTPLDGLDKAAQFVCTSCGYTEYRNLTSSDIGLPIITIHGSMNGISKDNKVKVEMTYEDGEETFTTLATMKYQGASSLYYPKHNFNIQFLNSDDSKYKVELSEGWGKESKYCLKANYVDFSQARNVVSGKLYGQIVHERGVDDEFDKLINGGAIDGFPVVIYHEKDFQGIYTMNIPKDKWLFNMGKGEKEAILMGDSWTDSVALRENVLYDFSNGWDLEYCSTDDTNWVADSFNEMISFLNNASYLDYMEHVNEYINEKRAIDSMLFTMMIVAMDNSSKNILWVTYDGRQWTPSMYDMDGVMGLYWNGEIGNVKTTDCMPESWCSSNLLWYTLFKYRKYEVANRYLEIRSSVMSDENIEKTILDFTESIPNKLYKSDEARWPKVPSHQTNNADQMISFMKERMAVLDKYFQSIVR